MEGLSGPHVSGAGRFRRLAVAAALFILVAAAVLLSGAPPAVKLAVTGVGMIGVPLAMAVGFRARATEAGRADDDPEANRRRRAWNLFVLASLLASVSNVLLIASAAAGPDVNRQPSDIVIGIAIVAGGLGVVSFPLAKRRFTDLLRMALDGAVIAGSALFVLSVIIFPDLLTQADQTDAVAVGVPVTDVITGTVAALLFMRGAPQDRPPLGFAALGFFSYSISDFAYALGSTAPGGYDFGSVTDLGWIVGYTLFALAAHSPGSEATPHGERPVERAPVLGTLVMFGLFLGAILFGLVQSQEETEKWSLTATTLAIVVLLGVMARQVLLIVDNDRLRRDLEQRVEDRTRSLRQATLQSRLLVSSVGDGIYGVDADGLVTFVNPAALSVLGYEVDELVGREAHATFHAGQDDGTPFPVASCYVTEAITEHKATNAEEDGYLRADGRLVPVEVTATPLIDDDKAIGAVVVFRDVTQRREVDRMKSEFVSIVSHELRTPVTAIHGALGLLAGGAVGELTPSAQRMVDIALTSSVRLGRLINEILDVERIESGMLSMELGTHEVRPLLESAVNQVQVLAQDAEVRVSVGAAEGQVYADADRVVQTLLNLLGNAIKFSHRGGYVSVRSEVKGDFVEIAVRDDGRGLPEEKLDTVFSRFQQVDSSDAREKGGFGLGLSISRSIVVRLGGRIWARNNAGAGATFLFTLPVAPRPVGAPEGTADQAEHEVPAAPDGSTVSEPAESRS